MVDKEIADAPMEVLLADLVRCGEGRQTAYLKGPCHVQEPMTGLRQDGTPLGVERER